VTAVNWKQEIKVRSGGCGRARDPLALLDRHGVESLCVHRTGVNSRSTFNATIGTRFMPRKVKNRQIELGIDAPHAAPIGCREEFGLGQLTRDPALERGLHPSRKHFEREDHVGPQCVQCGQGLQTANDDAAPHYHATHRAGLPD